jgi:glucose/mannose-6-phosphate isomerase
MKSLIVAFPQNIVDALEIAAKSNIRKANKSFKNVVLCGLGGSGIGAKIVANWIQDEINVPVVCLNEYTLPAFVDEHSLVIGSSYSGNTEETTLSMLEAKKRGSHIVGITSGGQLSVFCQENDYDCILVPGGNPPRSALAFSLVQLLHILSVHGLIERKSLEDMKSAVGLLNSEIASIHEIGKSLAEHLYQKVGILYAETKYEAVAVRARQQFNENSKYLCWHHVIPEMNHNELVGWTGGDKRFAPVFFVTEDQHPRNSKRFQITQKAVENKCGASFTLTAKGASFIERSLYLTHVVDWASFYLCEMNGADIFDIEIIDYLKGELAKF